MKPAPCPRLFEAEALRDGRLAGAERASFERHATVCSACAREVEALDALAGALRASPSEHADELRVRRERTRLLAAFDRELIAPERSSVTRLLWPAAIVALVATVLVFWRTHHVGESVQPVHAARAVVHADTAATWSDRMAGNREEIVLEHGALWIHVDHASGETRLVVVLPDGELEDTGTTFTVSAEDGRTARVAVQEGSVVLRVRGQPPMAIGPGDVWALNAPPASASVCASAVPSREPASSALPRSATARSEPSTRATAPLASALVRDPSIDFRAAMSALDRGDNREAAAGFASFIVTHPGDPRAEDAAYLRVIALQRCGDKGSMREAAREYLRRYPAAFRQAEVETLSQ